MIFYWECRQAPILSVVSALWRPCSNLLTPSIFFFLYRAKPEKLDKQRIRLVQASITSILIPRRIRSRPYYWDFNASPAADFRDRPQSDRVPNVCKKYLLPIYYLLPRISIPETYGHGYGFWSTRR